MQVPEDYPRIYLYQRIVQAKLFIEYRFSGPINLNNIADSAWFSKFHFIRLFKSAYNKTPHQYLTQVRIEKAKQLLQNGMPVSQVCYSVGFNSISSFTGLFKQVAGQTPSVYQRTQRQYIAEVSKMPLKFIPGCFAQKYGWTKKSNSQEVIA